MSSASISSAFEPARLRESAAPNRYTAANTAPRGSPACSLNTGVSKNGCLPSGTSPRRSVGNGRNSRSSRSGRRFAISLYSVIELVSDDSPPDFAVFRHSSATMSQRVGVEILPLGRLVAAHVRVRCRAGPDRGHGRADAPSRSASGRCRNRCRCPNRPSRSRRSAGPRPAGRASARSRARRAFPARSGSSPGPSVGSGKSARPISAMSRPRSRTRAVALSISAISAADRRVGPFVLARAQLAPIQADGPSTRGRGGGSVVITDLWRLVRRSSGNRKAPPGSRPGCGGAPSRPAPSREAGRTARRRPASARDRVHPRMRPVAAPDAALGRAFAYACATAVAVGIGRRANFRVGIGA